MVQRKLVGAKRYMSEATGPEPIQLGDVVDVTEEQAKEIDALYQKDALGNKHYMFSKDVAVEQEDDEEDAPAPRARRTKKAV